MIIILIIIIEIIIIIKNGVAGHNNHNKIKCDYLCSLRAVEFLVTIAINVFKRWRVVFESLHNLLAFPVPRNNWGS